MCIKYNVENLDLAVGDAMHAHSKVKCHLDLSVPQLVKSNTSYPYTVIRTLSNSFGLNRTHKHCNKQI